MNERRFSQIARRFSQIVVLLSVICLMASFAQAEVPRLINYQGKLTDKDGAPLEGAHNITFRIYDASTAGSLLWQETHTNLIIENGVLGVLLGSVTALNLDFGQPYWLAIKVGEDAEMDPRQQIASVGYALRAGEVDSLPAGIIAMWSGRIIDIPEGWALCDGTNGTPDLKDRFVKGVPDAVTNPGSTGGASSHAHSYSGTTGNESKIGSDHGGAENQYTAPQYPHNHSYSGTTQEASSLPPYYEVAFIMKL